MCGFQRFLHRVYRQKACLALECSVTAITLAAAWRLTTTGRAVRLVSSTAETAAIEHRPASRVALHAIGNIFIGVALGLVSYYFVTDFVTGRAQDALRDQIADLGTMGAPSPDRLLDEPDPGLTGWETWRDEDVAYWAGLEKGDIFGRIVIEGMDLDAVVVLGTGRDELKKGPGWITYTDLPGETGNVGIAGHRTTYGAPFRGLDDLEPGDIIHFLSPYRRYTYEVTEKFTVTPDQVEVMRTTEVPSLTLSACHPPYSAAYRLIVRAELSEMQRLEDTPGTPTP